ncbi:DNA alkylation repair protein [Thioclava sp. FR2]|uniref:DNA alkylation repair protein n=1 Tax=Thioclava sp. FR2 TaxID=3445780 RepID=UPI003EB74ADB
MTPDEALTSLRALGDPGKAKEMASYHKAPREYLGVSVPEITDLANGWRSALDLSARVDLSRDLWDTNIHEARIAAAKLLTQARITPDQNVWELFLSWVPDFDAWAIADHACDVGRRRLEANAARIEDVEPFVSNARMWTRRAALVVTLPYAKKNFPKPQELEIRERVLGWAADLASDKDWFIQKAVAWWLRDLSKHDAARTRSFLEGPGQVLKPWAQKEAARHLEN